MSLSCWIWNRTPVGQVGMRPPYGANCLVTIGSVSCGPVTISNSPPSRWVQLANGSVPLRCWWAEPRVSSNDIDSKSYINRAYIVLPEVFGVPLKALLGMSRCPRGHREPRGISIDIRAAEGSGIGRLARRSGNPASSSALAGPFLWVRRPLLLPVAFNSRRLARRPPCMSA